MSNVVSYTSKDAILYALGLGIGSEPDGEELKYVYEHHTDFQAFPTFPLVLQPDSNYGGLSPFPTRDLAKCIRQVCSIILSDSNTAQNRSSLAKILSASPILHIDQTLENYNRFPVSKAKQVNDFQDFRTHIESFSSIESFIPKQIGLFVRMRTIYKWIGIEPYDSNILPRGTVMSIATSTILFKGFRVKSPIIKSPQSKNMSVKPPWINNIQEINERVKPGTTFEPKYIKEFCLVNNQALLYRLSGDYNTIHVEGVSSEGIPILHGLCTLGFALRAVLEYWEHAYFVTFIKCKFTNPLPVRSDIRVLVFDTLESNVQDRCEVKFNVQNIATGEIVLDHGTVQGKRGTSTLNLNSNQLFQARL